MKFRLVVFALMALMCAALVFADDYEEDDLAEEETEEMLHAMGRVSDLADFDVKNRLKVDPTDTETFMKVWHRYDLYHPYPDEWSSVEKADLRNNFIVTAAKAILEEKAGVKELLYGSIAKILEKLEVEQPRPEPAEFTDEIRSTFEGLLSIMDSLDSMVEDDVKALADGEMTEDAFLKEVESKMESTLAITGWGVRENLGADEYDDEGYDGEDWDDDGSHPFD